MIATYAIFIDDVFASVESCIASVMIMTRRRRQIIVCFCPLFTLSTGMCRCIEPWISFFLPFTFFFFFFSPTKRPIDAFHRSWRTCPLITIKGTMIARDGVNDTNSRIYIYTVLTIVISGPWTFILFSNFYRAT